MPKQEIIVNKELGFIAEVKRHDLKFEFSIYEIEEATDSTDVLLDELPPDVRTSSRGVVIHGYVYWKHTSSWNVGTTSRYHCTSRDTLQKISKILTVCYDYTEKNLRTWDTEID